MKLKKKIKSIKCMAKYQDIFTKTLLHKTSRAQRLSRSYKLKANLLAKKNWQQIHYCWPKKRKSIIWPKKGKTSFLSTKIFFGPKRQNLRKGDIWGCKWDLTKRLGPYVNTYFHSPNKVFDREIFFFLFLLFPLPWNN